MYVRTYDTYVRCWLLVNHYKPGDCFGEKALLEEPHVRSATVTVEGMPVDIRHCCTHRLLVFICVLFAGGPMQCLTLDTASFKLLLGPLGGKLPASCRDRSVNESVDGSANEAESIRIRSTNV